MQTESTVVPNGLRLSPDAESQSKRRRRPSGEPPPLPHDLYASGRYWLGLVGVCIALWILLNLVSGSGPAITRFDVGVLNAIEGVRNEALTDIGRALHSLGSDWVVRSLRWALLLALLAMKRFRHLFVSLGSIFTVGAITAISAAAIVRARPFGVEILGPWEGASHPSRPVAALAVTLMCIAYTMVLPGRPRQTAKWVIGVTIGVVAAARLYLGVDHPTDVLFGIILGISIPLAAFRSLTPNDIFPVSYGRGRAAHLDVDGPRGEAIRSAIESQLGITITDVEHFGLGGSAGSTPLRLTVAGEPPTQLFAKLYAQTHLRADRWYKLGRTLLYGRLEDEASFNTVRRLVQYEDYLLRVMRDAGLSTPQPFGVVEITPQREYVLVTDFVRNAEELGDCDLTEDITDQCLRLVRQLWDAGLAHRDIKPSNLLVAKGRVHLIDVAFGEVRPSPWRQAVDLANMMLVLGLRSDPESVYRAALKYFSPRDIGEAFAATHSVTIPSQSRSWMKKEGLDLVKRFRELAPPCAPISIQRWSVRRVGLTLGIVILTLAATGMALSNFQGAGLMTPEEGTTSAYSGVSRRPDCEPSDQLVLVSQSVPSASLVPCLKGLPMGWSFNGADVTDRRTRIFLNSDRAGFRAVDVTLTVSCDIEGTTPVVPNDEPGTTRFEKVVLRDDRYVGSRYYVYPGGCTRYDFDLSGPGRTALAEEISASLTFIEKERLQEFLEKSGLSY